MVPDLAEIAEGMASRVQGAGEGLGVALEGTVVQAREVRQLDQASVQLGRARQITTRAFVVGRVGGKTT